MTYQEMFDKVLSVIRARGYTTAANQYGDCFFCLSDGTQCALGILVNAKFYNEQKARNDLARLFKCEGKTWPDFAHDLRSAHDTALLQDGATGFEQAMSLIAETYSLTYKEPA